MRVFKFLIAAALAVSCQASDPDWDFFNNGLRDDAGGQLSEERLEEARQKVREQRSAIDKVILETQWHADALRFLGDELFRREMFGPAIEAYAEALKVIPSSFSLWYRLGLSHAQLATLELDPDARRNRARMAATAYEKCIAIEGSHTSSRYGLAILLVFELGSPSQALPHLNRVLELEPRNTRALFVRARARYETNDLEGAIQDYDKIIEYSTDPSEQESARRNRSAVLGGVN